MSEQHNQIAVAFDTKIKFYNLNLEYQKSTSLSSLISNTNGGLT